MALKERHCNYDVILLTLKKQTNLLYIYKQYNFRASSRHYTYLSMFARRSAKQRGISRDEN